MNEHRHRNPRRTHLRSLRSVLKSDAAASASHWRSSRDAASSTGRGEAFICFRASRGASQEAPRGETEQERPAEKQRRLATRQILHVAHRGLEIGRAYVVRSSFDGLTRHVRIASDSAVFLPQVVRRGMQRRTEPPNAIGHLLLALIDAFAGAIAHVLHPLDGRLSSASCCLLGALWQSTLALVSVAAIVRGRLWLVRLLLFHSFSSLPQTGTANGDEKGCATRVPTFDHRLTPVRHENAIRISARPDARRTAVARRGSAIELASRLPRIDRPARGNLRRERYDDAG